MAKHKQIIKVLSISTALLLCFFGFAALLGQNQLALNAVAEETEQSSSGSLTYSDGSIYEGEILYGRIRNGTGNFTWSTGESYYGTWENDTPSGEGKMIWPNFGEYLGSFVNGKREGTGVFIWSYEGEPAEGAPVEYRGDWTGDQIGPNGTLTLAGIGKYEGAFSKQLRHGKGTFTWLNGDVYTGEWANDMINGKGTLTLSNGSVIEGEFAKGAIKNGSIKYSIKDGQIIRSIAGGKLQDSVEISYNDGTTVKGKVKGDEFVGNVTIIYSSGDTYTGAMKNGLKNGKGTYTWRSGAHYIGNWLNDKMSGTGKYYYSKDESRLYLQGNFTNGVPNGNLIYVADTKLKYQTVWKDGKCTDIRYKK